MRGLFHSETVTYKVQGALQHMYTYVPMVIWVKIDVTLYVLILSRKMYPFNSSRLYSCKEFCYKLAIYLRSKWKYI